MQYQPAVDVLEANRRQVDNSFVEFTEADPYPWEDKYIALVEEFVTYLGEDELLKTGTKRGDIMGLLEAIGKRYNHEDLMRDILEARISLLSGESDPISSEEQKMIDERCAFGPDSTTCFMALLRLQALEALKVKDYPNYVVKKGAWLQSYERIKYIFELKMCKVHNPPVFLYTTIDYTQDSALLKVIHDRTTEQVTHMFRDLHYVNYSPDTGYQRQPFLSRWLSDDNKKTFATCLFDPKGIIPENYNTFIGFRAEGLPPIVNMAQADQHMRMILTHIKEVYCNNDQAQADFIIRWFANIIKYPWKKTEVLILLFGVEGCGKGLVIDFFGNRVFGQHLSYQTATPGVDLFSKFAMGNHRKLFCFCDEAGEDLYKHHDQLKNLITSKTIRIEKKGHDIRIEENFMNLIVASNNTIPIRITPQDRRMVAFQCDDKYKGNYEYFDRLARAVNDNECARRMYEFLKGYDLPPDYSFQANRPITKYYRILQAASLNVFNRFLSFKCVTLQGSTIKIKARELFNEFKEWKEDRGYEASIPEAKFGRELKELAEKDKSGLTNWKSNGSMYEIRFNVLREFLEKKGRFDENAF